MKIKHIILVALTALALGLGSIGVGAPAIASIRSGLTGDFNTPKPAASSKPTNTGDFDTDVLAPAMAGSKPGIGSGSNNTEADVAGPAIAGSKPGASSGAGLGN